MGTRLRGPIIYLVAVAAVGAAPSFDGGAVANYGTAHTLTLGKRAVIRKIMWRNQTVADADLFVGYGDRTVAGSLFRRVLPLIRMIAGLDGELTEVEIPVAGNAPQGFQADTTPVTGTVGNILVGTTAAGVAAATPVEVQLEVEEV